MKKIFITTFLLALFASNTGFSQDKSVEEKAKDLTEKMKTQINFSDDKFEKVNAINIAFFEKTESLKSSGESKMNKMKNLKKLDEEREEQLKNVLSEEEFKAFKENKSENRKAFKEKFKNQ